MNIQTEPQSLDSLRAELVADLNSGPKTETETLTTETPPKPIGKEDGSTTKPETTETEIDDKAKKPVTTTEKPKDETLAEGEKPKEGETPYSKAKKDSERFRTNWTELERGKTELKAAQAELEKARQQIVQERQRIDQERLKVAKATNKTSEYTPEQLEAYAKEFEAEGKPELAVAARAKAKAQREAVTVEQQQQAKAQHEQYVKTSQEHWDKAQSDFPDVAKADSPLRKRADEVYRTVVEELNKNGIRPAPSLQYLAVQHANALLAAETAQSEVEGLKTKVTELETENKRLTKSTALPGAKPTQTVPAGKDFNALPLDQQRDQLRAGLTQA